MKTDVGPWSVEHIVYLHGFGSCFEPDKPKIRALATVLPVSGTTVDYTKHPDEVFALFHAHLMNGPTALIVGTSLGGFFAAWLAAEAGLPFIAINPAVNPAVALGKHLGAGVTYSGSPFFLDTSVVAAYADRPFRMDGRGEVVLDEGDEVLSTVETVSHIGAGLLITVFEGGSHRFDHMEQLAASLRVQLLGKKGERN